MLPASVRRVVSTTPPSALLSNLASPAARSSTSTTPAAALAFSYNPRCQQRRRYSSSKPSSPNDSNSSLPARDVAAAPAADKQGGEKRKRKGNTAKYAAQRNLPSVPSTEHVPQAAMALSTFFSLHRPMSVTHTFPKTVTDEAFAQIFAPLTKTAKMNHVMSTLSSTVDDLEQPMQSLNVGSQQPHSSVSQTEGDHMKVSIQHSDGSDSDVYVELNAMSGQFLPFRPPPAPEPTSNQTGEAGAEMAAAENVPEHRTYKAMLTLEETVDAAGQTRIVAHSPKLLEEPGEPRTFLERMAVRHMRREEVRGQSPGMLAISVVRQRKLRMKKKKYKKLMKRTRNERLKLNRV